MVRNPKEWRNFQTVDASELVFKRSTKVTIMLYLANRKTGKAPSENRFVQLEKRLAPSKNRLLLIEKPGNPIFENF